MKAAFADLKIDQSLSMQSIAAALQTQTLGFSDEGIET